MLCAFPRQAAVQRVIPKNKLYEHGEANTALRALFVDQVAKVTLTHVLSPDSTNLSAAGGVEEIDVFRLDLHLPRAQDLDQRVLYCCDRVIPRPTLFEIHAEDGIQIMAQVKLPAPDGEKISSLIGSKQSAAGATLVGAYLRSAVFPLDAQRQPLPLVTSLLALYEIFLESLLDIKRYKSESINNLVCRQQELSQLDRRITVLRKRMNAEVQFNRRVELNSELRDLEAQRIIILTSPR